jgi:uncharacterized protein (DUF433 family)
MSENLLSRITIDPNICHGKPTIRGSRMMVESILEYLAGGDSLEDVLEAFPDLEKDDVLAALAYANRILRFKGTVFPAA